MKYAWLMLILALFVVAIPAQAQDPVFEADECPFEVPASLPTPIECGYLIVPEDRSNPDSESIELAVAILSSRSATPAPDPVIFLEGGPGGSALLGIEDWYNLPFLDTRDMVLIDQRGTGFSFPSLDCIGIEDEEDYTAALEACRGDFEAEGINLSAYNSAESAADIRDLTVALGYDQVNLLGISYGTRLGLTIMRDYPEIVRSAVLDSVYPPNIDTTYVSVSDLYAILNEVFADCEADSACAAAFPDLESRFFDTLEGGISGTAEDPETGELIDIDEFVVVEQAYQSLFNGLGQSAPAAFDALANGDYDAYWELATFGGDVEMGGMDVDASFLSELFPEEIAELEDLVSAGDADAIADYLSSLFDGPYEEFLAIGEGLVSGDISLDAAANDMDMNDGAEAPEYDNNDGDSLGMNLSVQCNEEIAFLDEDTAFENPLQAGVPELFVEIAFTNQEWLDCEIWNVEAADPIENDAVVSDIPTLLVSGEYDPGTPASWGDLAAESLSNSTHLVFPYAGHSLMTSLPSSCPGQVAQQLYENPTAQPDTSCWESYSVPFYIP